MEHENIFANHILNKRLISKLYKESCDTIQKQNKTKQLKMGKGLA